MLTIRLLYYTKIAAQLEFEQQFYAIDQIKLILVLYKEVVQIQTVEGGIEVRDLLGDQHIELV